MFNMTTDLQNVGLVAPYLEEIRPSYYVYDLIYVRILNEDKENSLHRLYRRFVMDTSISQNLTGTDQDNSQIDSRSPVSV
jgi:hypothetical protein